MSARTLIWITTPTVTNTTRLMTPSAASSVCLVSTEIYTRGKRLGDLELAAYYDVTNDPKVLAIAERAATWVIDHRSLPAGGFRHGDKDRGGPFLGDQLAMGQAFLDLYAATGNRVWLTSAARTGEFVASFKDDAGGFLTAKTSEGKTGVFAKPAKLIDDQIQVGALHEHAQPLLWQPGLSRAGLARDALPERGLTEMARPLPGVLLADEELALEPTHMTIVGHKDDARAQALHALARVLPARYNSGWSGSICARASFPTPTLNIPISANPQRSPAATASARSRPSPPRSCRPM